MKSCSLIHLYLTISASISLIVLAPAWFSSTDGINAQQCPDIPRYGSATVWQPGSTVSVVIDQNSNLTDTELEALRRAIQNWNSVNGNNGNNSGVTISLQFTTSSTPPDPGTSTSVLYISRAPLTGDDATATMITRTERNNNTPPGYTSIARMVINANVSQNFNRG